MSRAHKAFGSKTFTVVHELMSDRKARTAREISELLNLKDTSVSGVMRLMEKRGQAYIKDWPLNRQGKPAALWKLGKGKSIERPKTRKEVGDKTWRNLHPLVEKKEDSQPWHETFRPFRDPLVEALFGEYRSAA